MKLHFQQRLFSWLDSYDIYNENGTVAYTVEGQLDWGHCLHILDVSGRHIGTVRERVMSFLPRFELIIGEQKVGEIRKELTFFRPRFQLDCRGWQVEGDLFEWDYRVTDTAGRLVMTAEKQLLHWTDTYLLDIGDDRDALYALMIVLAIDAAKCSAGS